MEFLTFLLLITLIRSTFCFDCETLSKDLKDPSLKPFFIKECQDSSNWSQGTDKQQVWEECVKEQSLSPYKECLASNGVLPLDVIDFFGCYESKLGLSQGSVNDGYEYNMFRVAVCESSDTHQSYTEMYELLSHCMIKLKGVIEVQINPNEYVEFWECVMLQYWYNGHGGNHPPKTTLLRL
uniref:DUF19 domain-containing protein n=1 Tax=Megaselia scalaris TaxID=36166 RepID=T1GL45_MEGSC